jgi:hypothetical protein
MKLIKGVFSILFIVIIFNYTPRLNDNRIEIENVKALAGFTEGYCVSPPREVCMLTYEFETLRGIHHSNDKRSVEDSDH